MNAHRLHPQDAGIPERGSLRPPRPADPERGPFEDDWIPAELAPAPVAPPVEPAPLKDRLVVNESVVHHPSAGGRPSVAESRFLRFLESDEQPYVRRVAVGEVWQPLPDGWLKEASMLSLVNEKPTRRVQPTPAERAETEGKVVEVGLKVLDRVQEFAVLAVGESARFQPADLESLRLRCRQGEAKVTVSVFPA